MAPAADRAAEQSYLELCKQLGAGPCEPFLQCLQEGSRSCKLSHFEQEEQLYATATLLPYAGLQELDLSGLRLSFDGWISILESCAKCPGLQVLSLKGCDLGLVGEITLHVVKQPSSCSETQHIGWTMLSISKKHGYRLLCRTRCSGKASKYDRRMQHCGAGYLTKSSGTQPCWLFWQFSQALVAKPSQATWGKAISWWQSAALKGTGQTR